MSHRKVILVVLDGLRPDAITPDGMPVLSELERLGWHTRSATTVRPSVTVAALTSIGTGVAPATHGLTEAGPTSLSRLRSLRPLPLELRRLGVETTIVTPALSGPARWVAGALLRLGGITRQLTAPAAPGALVREAVGHAAGNSRRELIVVYLNDADIAGHAWGWMSPAYAQAAATLDRALAPLRALAEDPEALVFLTADHGGGGVLSHDHDHPHPLNEAIPLAILGGRVAPGMKSDAPVRLLDIPPTVLHGFGGAAPPEYEGRVIHEAFVSELVWA